MELTADLIYGFTASLLSTRFDNPQPTPNFHKELWGLCCDKHPNVAISAPRGHAKSTAVTHAYGLASVLFRTSEYLVIVSDTEPQSIAFLNDIKMELAENEELRALFKVKRFIKENEKEIIVEIGPGRHFFKIVAKSSGQSVRGLKWRGKRPDLIICDDLENDEIVMNQDRREKFRNWFFGALMPVLSDTGKIRVVGTILHFDSLLERLMPDTTGENAKYTISEPLKDYSIMENPVWKAVKFRGHPDIDDFSELLWPEKFSIERYKLIMNNYIEQGYIEGYAQEYLNIPLVEAAAFFRRDDFLPMEKEDYKSQGNYYAASDFAISTKAKSDYTVFVVGKVDSQGMLNIVDVIRERMDSKEIIEEMFNIQLRYQPELFITEKGAIEKAIGPFLKDEMLKRNVFINLHAETPLVDKRSRARSIQGRLRQGGVKFDKEASWYPAYEQEMLRFDKGAHDDQVDATAWLGLVLNKMLEAPTQEEMDEEAWQQEYDDTYAMFEGEQMSITGY